MNLPHPQSVAQQVADLLESDPIAAAQVKEFINPLRILELLEFSSAESIALLLKSNRAAAAEVVDYIGLDRIYDLLKIDGPDDDDEDEDDDVRV